MLNMKKLLTKILTGFVKKTGDTMIGKLVVDNYLDVLGGRRVTIYSGQNIDDTRTGDYWNSYYQVYDKDNTQSGDVSGMFTVFGSDGASRLCIGASRKNTSGTRVSNLLNLIQRKDGTRSVSVTDAAAWRTALGVPGTATATTSANGLMSSSDKTAVNKINNTMFKYKSYTYNYSNLAAGKTVNIKASDLGISVPSGYRILGVFYFATGATAVSVDLVAGSNTGSQTVARLRNNSSSAASGTCTIGITWVKNDFISAL